MLIRSSLGLGRMCREDVGDVVCVMEAERLIAKIEERTRW